MMHHRQGFAKDAVALRTEYDDQHFGLVPEHRRVTCTVIGAYGIAHSVGSRRVRYWRKAMGHLGAAFQ